VHAAVKVGNFDIGQKLCQQICIDLGLPAISYFMSVKNYAATYFAAKNLSQDDEYKLKFLHYVVVKYSVEQWKLKDQPKPVTPIINRLDLTV
jgi:hypothetical protein